MAKWTPGGSSGAAADAVNARLLELLEQVVANQAVQATAHLQDEIAERVAAEARYRDRTDRAAPAIGYPEQQVALRFRAVRNALGSFGRFGEQDAALLPAPRLHPDGTLEFVEALPNNAGTAILFRADGTELGRAKDVGGHVPVIKGADETAWIQVDDVHGYPLLLGFPQRVPGGIV